ncbi:T6SS phospholipase effector Tle1-like catalytic domain-containing protein [Duganella vulcania]|uniref:T6SS phospholipase effector Tle1-like catalytic domain-containing protein n=1 Tax=Duganella vulcania TaxID=2692166 RepID=UPI0020C3AD7C|nr:DUF2235 domain-containing protein [Duganella vulcania]
MIETTPVKAPYPTDVFLKPTTEEQSKIAAVASPIKSDAPCSIPVRVGVFFDGTNNNLDRDKNGRRTGVIIDPRTKEQAPVLSRELKPEEFSHSNVARLFQAFPSNKPKSGYFPYYIAGVGTPFREIGELTETDDGKAFAKGGQARIIWGLFQVINSLYRMANDNKVLYSADEAGELAQSHENQVGQTEWDAENKQHTRKTHRDWFEPHLQKLSAKLASKPKPSIPSLTISVFGFSRGGAEATAFCHYLSELLSDGKLAGIPTSIDFLGVFDVVATVGMSDSAGRTTPVPRVFFDGHWAWAKKLLLPLPDCVKGGRHYIAAHEQRMNFPVTQLQTTSSEFAEVYFPGMHSDVGGGYAPGEYGKGRGAQSAMLSQIPLAYMFKAAREAGVPLLPFSELTTADQDDFQVGAELASAWNAYTDELGDNGHLIKEHMKLYYRWRAARLTTLESTASFKASSPQAQEDLRSSNRMLSGDLEAVRWRLEHKNTVRTDADTPPYTPRDLSRINQWHYYRALQYTPLDSWEEWALEIFNKPEPLPAEVMRFFDDYVHDSLAGFYLAGAVTEFDKRQLMADVKKKWWRNKFEDKVFALGQKIEAAKAKEKKHEPLTDEEKDLLEQSKYDTPFPIMTDADAADMRSPVITTQTATRREGGGYLLRRSYYPLEGFIIRKSIHEKELDTEPTSSTTPKKVAEQTAEVEYVWVENLPLALARGDQLLPDFVESDRMVA